MTQQQYANPDEIASRNPAQFYPDGVFDSFVPPQLALSWRPEGSAFRPSSDYRQTRTPETLRSPGARRRGKGHPWRPTYPDLPVTPQAPVAVHDPTAAGDTSTPMTQGAMQAGVDTSPVALTWWDRIMGGWATSPVGMLFLALASVVLVNQLVFRQRGVSRGASAAGAGVAGVGSAAAGGAADTGGAAIDAVNKAVGGAVEAVEDIAK